MSCSLHPRGNPAGLTVETASCRGDWRREERRVGERSSGAAREPCNCANHAYSADHTYSANHTYSATQTNPGPTGRPPEKPRSWRRAAGTGRSERLPGKQRRGTIKQRTDCLAVQTVIDPALAVYTSCEDPPAPGDRTRPLRPNGMI